MGTPARVIVLALFAAGGSVNVTRSQDPPARIDRALISESIESLATIVNREYFDPGVAAAVASALRSALAEARYDNVTTPEALAQSMNRDLFAATHDKHLVVSVALNLQTDPSGAETADDASRALQGRRANFGVRRVEILPGNIGYLDLTAFYRLNEAQEAIATAMQMLRYADALIIDMRENGGGAPDTVARLASYLFDAPALPLFEIAFRSGPVARYVTDAAPLADRNGTRPVFVLTAARTFSAGEGFAYVLQDLRRATIVGERTAGAANPGRAYVVNSRFSVTVPNGRVRSAGRGGNWEGTGVAPDVRVEAGDALRVAQMSALGSMLKDAPAGDWRDTLEQLLKSLDHR